MPASYRRVVVLFPEELYQAMEQARGDVLVSTFVRRAVEGVVDVRPTEVKRGRPEITYDFNGGQASIYDD